MANIGMCTYMGNNHGYKINPASVEIEETMQTEMEESFPTLMNSLQQHDSREPKPKGVPDDLTNLNWVAGIPVPMNTSVSPPEGSRTKRLYFGSPSAKDLLVQHQEIGSPTTPTFSVPARTKSLKTPLPTYKIVLNSNKDYHHTRESCCYSPSTNHPSPEKRDSVILANIVASGNGYHEPANLEPEKIVIEDDDCCIDYDKHRASLSTQRTCDLHLEKPNCSYTCLIGMALKASSGCLPVNAIYQYIEKEFPYFINAPDGWKNSVRHNLSLNPIFRKVSREGWTGKKGYLWKVCPDKQDIVNKEILRFLHCTGKKLGEFTPPTKATPSKYKQQRPKKPCRALPIPENPIFCSRCTRIVSPTPQESSTSSDDSYLHSATNEELKNYSADIQEEVVFSDVHLKPGSTVTQTAFDLDKSPTKYIGIKSPPQDPKDVAKEMFGLCPPNPDNANAFYPQFNYGGPFIPLYAQPGQFGIPYENFEQVANSSSSSDASPMAAQLFPHYPQYAVPMPFPCILGGQYPQMYNCTPYDDQGGKEGDMLSHTFVPMPPPLSVKVLSSSDQVELPGAAEIVDCVRKSSTGKRCSNDDYCSSTDVASLSSPMKRMKVIDDQINKSSADDSISAYFADISANSTCSDDDAEENEEVSNIMSTLSKQRHHLDNLHLAGLNYISTEEKQSLEQIAGTSDLDSLLNKGLESLVAKTVQQLDSDVQSPPPPGCSELPETKYAYGEDCSGVSTMDMHEINAKVAASQEDSYYLPSLDSLLNIGEDTIITMKAAMNLDIQGVVEIATEDTSRDMEASTGAHTSTKSDQIQIN